MLVAPHPDDEAERLASLRRLGVLDTPAEPEFDALTAFASQLCGTPIALISLVDAERQWFKSRVGLDATETPREVAFCAHAILQRDVFEVYDTAGDPRFSDNPLVRADPHVRFYAGTPLIDGSGHALGTLCVVDRIPRELTPLQREGLKVLGRQVIAQLELRQRLRELAELSEDLLRARDAALAGSRAKDMFLGNMGHELRTPLNAILGCAEMLIEDATRSERDDLLPDLRVIESAGKHLMTVIEDILDDARLQAGRMPLRRVAFAPEDVLREVESAVRPQLASKQLAWRQRVPDPLGELRSDPTKLRQILFNLLGNAIKFTAAGAIELAARRVAGPGGDLLEVAVTDTGVGIPGDKLGLLFREFSQIDPSPERTQGTGLGLALSRRLARLLGGDITVTSEPGRGSTFTLRLPVVAPEPAAGP